MRSAEGRLALAATDLSSHLACGHLTSLRRAAALGEIARPTPYDDPRADVLRQRGVEASLSLALADQVADLAATGTARLESMFLDEGFGSLDPETLDDVATALEELG